MRDPVRDRQPSQIENAVTPCVTFCMTLITLAVTQGHVWLNHASRTGSRLPPTGGGRRRRAAHPPTLGDDT